MLKISLARADLCRRLPALLMLIPLSSMPALAQDKVNVASAPKDLMLRAASQNGLMGDDLPPWHLKASFTEFDDDGKVSEAGSYEELWISQTKFKRTFAGKGFSETTYGTAKGSFRADVRGYVPLLLVQAGIEFSAPLPGVDLIGKGSFEVKEIETGGIKLECLRSNGTPINPDRTYCVGSEKPFLRLTSSAGQQEQILHNRILGFQGRFIAGDLQFVVAGKRRLTAHLETIESLNPVDEAIFTLPADAVSVPRTVDISVVNVSAAVSTGMLLRKVVPEYPYFARQNHITGAVVLQALIGKDGHIQELQVVSGPSELQKPALEAVHQWLYRPYFLNGEPVAVRTTINVIFTMSR